MSTNESTVTEFLLARIAEDEAQARQAIESRGEVAYADEPEIPDMGLAAYEDAPIPTVLIGPERVLAECEAKRRIVAWCTEPGPGEEWDGLDWDGDLRGVAENVLRGLASVYADHPDFREEWRPR